MRCGVLGLLIAQGTGTGVVLGCATQEDPSPRATNPMFEVTTDEGTLEWPALRLFDREEAEDEAKSGMGASPVKLSFRRF